MVGQAKQAKQARLANVPVGRQVTVADLRAVQASDQRVQEAGEYFAVRRDLMPAERDALLDWLLSGPPTDDALRAVLGLLRAAHPADLARLVRRLGESLVRRIPPC